jgi:dienelactone hydrolase
VRLLLTVILCCAASLSQAASNFTFDVAPGPHGVGLRVVEQYDHARSYLGNFDLVTGKPVGGEKARPMQTVVWYPAQKAGKRVTYGDYARLTVGAEKFGRSEAEIAAATAAWLKQQRSDNGHEQANAELARPMWAVRDGKPAPGKFPVVIYAPSFSANAAENADLCEYLASHGYVVIASPSMGAHARGMSDDLEGIETQAADIAFLIGYAHTLPQADTARLAVAGYSWGGISNVFVAARDSRVKALVNLDGSVRYWPDMIAQAKYVVPARVAVPMLFLAQRPRSLEELAKRDKPAVSFLNDMKYADLYNVTLHPMEHFAFSSEALRFIGTDNFNEYSAAEVSQAHGWMARYVLQFLNAYLLEQGTAKTFLSNTPRQNGVPSHMITAVTQLAEGPAPTLEMLAAESSKTGFGNVEEVYAAMRKRDPKFALPEPALNNWGYKLLAAGDKRGALAVLKLVTTLHPESGNAYDSLAEAYEANEDKARAIENYQRALKLNPGNDNAARHLKALGAPN